MSLEREIRDLIAEGELAYEKPIWTWGEWATKAILLILRELLTLKHKGVL